MQEMVNSLDGRERLEEIVDEYHLESYKKVSDDCIEKDHTITGGQMLYECLKHNFAWEESRKRNYLI